VGPRPVCRTIRAVITLPGRKQFDVATFGRGCINAFRAASVRLQRSNKFNSDLIVTSPHDGAALAGLTGSRQRQKEFVGQTFDIVNCEPRSTIGHIDQSASLKTRIVTDVDPCRQIEVLSRPSAFVVAHGSSLPRSPQLIDRAKASPVVEPKMFSAEQTELAAIDSNYPLTPRCDRKVRWWREPGASPRWCRSASQHLWLQGRGHRLSLLQPWSPLRSCARHSLAFLLGRTLPSRC
jgi:hypothetical protein